MKKIAIIFMVSIMAIGSIFLSGCSDKKYQVSQEEYEKAFTSEKLSNVTISAVGSENVHLKEKYCCVGDNYSAYYYYDNLQFYGEVYEIKDGEESCYLYGNEDFDRFTEEDVAWRKSEIMFDKNSLFHNAKFVALYKTAFHLLEYDRKEKSYHAEITSQGQPFLYTYYFSDKKLKKIEITSSANENYYRIMEFYDYGTTAISMGVEDIELIEEYFSDLENKSVFIEAYASKYGKKVSIANYYGRYESGAIVAKMNTADTEVVWSETVGEHTIMYNNGNRIIALYNGEFYTLSEAYQSGYLTENDITDIALKI